MALTRIRAQQISDIDYKQAVRVITVANVTLSGGAPSTVDGVNLVAGDRILVAGQTTGSENGLYDVSVLGTGSDGTWVRTADGDVTGEIQAGMIVMVTEGTVYRDTQWKLTTNNPIIIGTTSLVFEQNTGYAFGNLYANGTAVLANAASGTVTFTAGDNIAITGNNTSKTVTIGVTGLSLNSIANGSSNVNVVSSGGDVTVGVGGVSNVAVFSTSGMSITDAITAGGNITGNFFLGNGSQLTGIDATSIQSGTSNVRVLTSGGNVSVGVGGSAILRFTSDGIVNDMGNGTGNIGNSTGYFNTIFAKATSAQYADLAENYLADGYYPPGTVMIFGGRAEVTQSISSDDHRVAGVVSTQPSHLMNAGQTGEHVVALALQGRVPCRVTGFIARGDLLVSGPSGLAQANNQARAGTIIGKALQSFSGEEGLIEIAVGRD